MSQKLIRWPAVKERTDLSRATIDRYERKGRFPQRVRVDPSNDAFNSPVAWYEHEVAEWVHSRVRAASDADVEREWGRRMTARRGTGPLSADRGSET